MIGLWFGRSVTMIDPCDITTTTYLHCPRFHVYGCGWGGGEQITLFILDAINNFDGVTRANIHTYILWRTYHGYALTTRWNFIRTSMNVCKSIQKFLPITFLLLRKFNLTQMQNLLTWSDFSGFQLPEVRRK